MSLERKVCSPEGATFHIKQEADADLNTWFALSLLEKGGCMLRPTDRILKAACFCEYSNFLLFFFFVFRTQLHLFLKILSIAAFLLL